MTNFKKRRLIDEPLPEERIRVARAAYFGLCEYFDRKVGQLLDKRTELTRDMHLLTAWGQTVQPLHEDTLPVEDVEDVVRC